MIKIMYSFVETEYTREEVGKIKVKGTDLEVSMLIARLTDELITKMGDKEAEKVLEEACGILNEIKKGVEK